MINYNDIDDKTLQNEEALDILQFSPKDCEGMHHAKIREGYIEILFKVRIEEIYSYVDKFRKLKCNKFYEACFDRHVKDFLEYHFFFTIPPDKGVNFFDRWPCPLAEGEGRYA
jgi:hypothetical protein